MVDRSVILAAVLVCSLFLNVYIFLNSKDQQAQAINSGTFVAVPAQSASGLAEPVAVLQPSPAPAAAASFDEEAFLRTFRAHDPQYQQFCVDAIRRGPRGDASGGSQFGQDVFVWRNVFADRSMRGEKGFYVESGANHYKTLSTTLFYDKCLGWDGLCIEPMPRYHAELRQHRSCKLVPECITDHQTTLTMQMAEGTNARVSEGSPPKGGTTMQVQCRPLDEMLAAVGRTHVDLWVLDVEGHERVILDGLHWEKLTFSALLIEDNKLWQRMLDYRMSMRGFMKLHQLAIDSLFVPRGRPFWYPLLWKSYEKLAEMTQKPAGLN